MPREKFAPSAPNGVPSQPDRERPKKAPPKKRRKGRTVTTQGPGRPVPTDRAGTPAFQREQGGEQIQLPVLHGGPLSPQAALTLRREFGVFEHPLPANQDARAKMQALAEAYKARTGQNLLQQRDPKLALQRAGFGGAPPGMLHHRPDAPTPGVAAPEFLGAPDRPWLSPSAAAGRAKLIGGLAPDRAAFGQRGDNFRDRINLRPDTIRGEGQATVNDSPFTIRGPDVGLPGRTSSSSRFGGGIRVEGKEATPTPERFLAAAANIERLGGLRPTITIDPSMFDGLGIMDAYASGEGLTDEQKQELIDQYGEMGLFSTSQRAKLIDQAKTNGWSDADVRPLTDMDLVDRAFDLPGEVGVWQRRITNFGKNVAQLGAIPLGGVAIGSAGIQAARGNTDPLRDIGVAAGEQVINALPFVGDPVEAFNNDPLFTATMFSGLGRVAGAAPRLGGLARGRYEPVLSGGRRNVALPDEFANPQTGAPSSIDLGAASQNLLVRAPQAIREAAVSRSPWLADRAVARGATRGATISDHLGKQAGNERSAPLLKAFKAPTRAGRIRQALTGRGLSDEERMAVEYFAIQGRDPQATIDTFMEKIDNAATTPSGRRSIRNYRHQIEQAKAAQRALARLDPETIARVKAAAKDVEAKNQADLEDLGMTPESLEDRLWDVTEREQPGMRESGAEPPAMYFPHTPGQATRGGMKRSKPLITGKGGARDAMGGRLEDRKMLTYESGKLLQDPNAFEAAAGAPARAVRTASEMERRVAEPYGHRIDLGTHKDAEAFDYDDDDWVIVQSGDTRFGATRKHPGVSERRPEEMRDLMDRTNTGDTEAAKELFRRTFNVVERDPTTGRPQMGPGTYYAIRRSTWDALEDQAGRAASRGGGLGEATRIWKSLTLNTLPRTMVNNVFGSMPMSAAGGAGPMSYVRAAGNLAKGEGDLIPGELRGVGLSGAGTHKVALGDHLPQRLVSGWMNGLRRGNVFGEDAARAAVYMKGAHKLANKQGGKRFFAGVRGLSDEARGVMQKWADDGESRPPEVEALIDKSMKFVGDMRGGKYDNALSLAVPFHRWYRHIVRLTLVTMPVHYPGRSLFLQELGAIGDEYRKEHGVFPEWMNDLIPVRELVDQIPGYNEAGEAVDLPQRVLGGFRTSSLNPFATTTQLKGFNEALGGLSPLVATPFELGLNRHIGGPMHGEPFKDARGNEVEQGSGDWLRVGANSVIGAVPIAKWFAGFFGSPSGQADTSIPIFDEQRRIRTSNGKPIPEEWYPPDSSPGGFIPTILRGFGLPYAEVDSSGPRYGRTVKSHYDYARRERTRRLRQKAQDAAR